MKILRFLSVIIISMILLASTLEAKGSRGFGGGFKGSFGKSSFGGGSSTKTSFFGSKHDSSPSPAPKQSKYAAGGYYPDPVPTRSKYAASGYTDSSVKSQSDSLPSSGSNYVHKVRDETASMNSFEKARMKAEQKKASKEALAAFESKKNDFKAQSTAREVPLETTGFNPKYASNAKNNSDYKAGNQSNNLANYGDRYERRNDFYTHHTPASYYNRESFAPSYGRWDGFFLGYIVSDAMGDLGKFMYHNSSDPAVSEWKKAMEEEAKTNAELKAKLDSANAEIAQMQKDGVVKEPGYTPPSVDKDVAFTPAYADKNKEKIYDNVKPEEEKSSNTWVYVLGSILLLGAAGWFIFGRRTLD